MSSCTKDPIQPRYILTNISAFYVEGSSARVFCANYNLPPFTGVTAWVDPMNMLVGRGGFLPLNDISRKQAGLYTCAVMLYDQTITVKVPTRSFSLVVHCKL